MLGALFGACRPRSFSSCWLLLSSLRFLKILLFPFDALGPRGGPYFLLLQKVGKDRRKGVSPPCESPDQSGVLDAPLWKPPSLAALSGLAELLAACAAGASVPLGKARAPARSPRPPHLHRFGVGASPPGPPRFPKGNACQSCANAHGTASETAFAATPPQISRKLLPRKRLGVPSLPSRELRPQAAPARPPAGESQRGRSPLWPVFAYFLLTRK